MFGYVSRDRQISLIRRYRVFSNSKRFFFDIFIPFLSSLLQYLSLMVLCHDCVIYKSVEHIAS